MRSRVYFNDVRPKLCMEENVYPQTFVFSWSAITFMIKQIISYRINFNRVILLRSDITLTLKLRKVEIDYNAFCCQPSTFSEL